MNDKKTENTNYIEVEWAIEDRMLTVNVNHTPGHVFNYSDMLYASEGPPAIFHGGLDAGTNEGPVTTRTFVNHESAAIYRDVIQAEIDRYNAEHAEQETDDTAIIEINGQTFKVMKLGEATTGDMILVQAND